MSILFSHPTGNANTRAALRGLQDAGILQQFITTIASFEGGLLDQIGRLGPMVEIRRRRYDPLLKAKTTAWPWREAGRLFAAKAGFHSLTRHESGLFSIDAVYRGIDQNLARRLKRELTVEGVYAYEDGARDSFEIAKERGVSCLYDLPTGYWRSARRLLGPEPERSPEWANTMTGFLDSEAKLKRKDDEIGLADHIFVASSFTASTLREYPGTLPSVHVIPYGFPNVSEERSYAKVSKSHPLRILFVGKLSQQKGIADLIQVADNLGQKVELTLVGRKAVHDCQALNAALKRHTWIPSIPNHAVIELMRNHDVFAFPSLFDGYGMVISEAMSQGTPVITTDRTAGPDLIEHGRNGWLVEAGSTPALQAAIEGLLHHPEQIAANGREAMETARQRPWEVYGRELAAAIMRVI